jgi:hypothetical protein
LICIFAELREDNRDDHIYGHIKTGHNSYYGHFPTLAIMARPIMAINMVFMGVSSKNSKNADQLPKRFLKIYKWSKIMAITNLSPK